jgi:hypothetical protein
MKKISCLTGLAFALVGSLAGAQERSGRLDTMTLMPEHAVRPDVVTAAIDLPKDLEGAYRPSAQGVENSARGLETANLAREDGRAFGQATAAAARANREDAALGSRPDVAELVPEHVTLPELPALPERPELPEGPELPARPELPALPDRPTPPRP